MMFPAWMTPWRGSLMWSAVLSVVAITAIVGLLFGVATAEITSTRAHKQVDKRLFELLDTVERTVSIACYVKDQGLAEEVARGLLANSEVAGVLITVDGKPLAKAYRNKTGASQPGENTTISRSIWSPFKPGQVVGQIAIEPNQEEISALMRNEVLFMGSLIALLLSAIAVSMSVGLLTMVVRPIKAISDRLHNQSSAEHELHLQIPWGHKGTEIGQLVGDINSMDSKLREAVKVEREQRIKNESEERRFRTIFNNAGTGIFVIDADGHVISNNRAFDKLLGEVIGPGSYALRAAPFQDLNAIDRMVRMAVDRREDQVADLALILPSGEKRWLNILLTSDGSGVIQGLLHDVTERKKAEEDARKVTMLDPVTGLWNRNGLAERLMHLSHLHSSGPPLKHALLLVDIDPGQRIKEMLGFQVGDQILSNVAKRLRSSTDGHHAHDIAYVGSGLFAALLDLEVVNEYEWATQIIAVLRQPIEVGSGPITLDVNAGVTLFPDDSENPDLLFRNAELALARSRSSGGNRCHYFNESMVQQAEYRKRLELDIQLALRRNEFELAYQPVFDLLTEEIVGVEALIRWKHPTRGMIPPHAFIPLAEESAAICDIGTWALNEVCSQLETWYAMGLNIRVSINVSARQVPGALQPNQLSEAVALRGLPASCLLIEVTESVLVHELPGTAAWFNAVRGHGFDIILDDFGGANSSLNSLRRIKVDNVKLDRSLIRDMTSDESCRAIVAGTIKMAAMAKIQSVAEGIETAEQVIDLKSIGCRYGQGNYFAKPMSPSELVDVVKATQFVAQSQRQVSRLAASNKS